MHIDLIQNSHPKIYLHVDCREFDRPGDQATYAALTGIIASSDPNGAPSAIRVFSESVEVADIEVFQLDTATIKTHEELAATKGINITSSKLQGFTGRISKLLVDWKKPLTVYAEIEQLGQRFGFPIARLSEINPHRIKVGYAEKRKPILVKGLGRSGTSLMMSYLAAHPQIAVAANEAFEFRQASYLWHAVSVMTSPAQYKRSIGPDLFELAGLVVGANPYFHRGFERQANSFGVSDWLDSTWPSRYLDFVKHSIDEFYDKVDESCGANGTIAFAEKASFSHLGNVVRNIYHDSREIICVRDFRDIFISARAFNQRRASASFGRENMASDADWLKSFRAAAGELCKSITERSIVVRYEDIVQDPRVELGRLFKDLSIDYSTDLVNGVISSDVRRIIPASHRTSQSEKASIGRWRTEMSAAERKIARDYLNEALSTFGYELE